MALTNCPKIEIKIVILTLLLEVLVGNEIDQIHAIMPTHSEVKLLETSGVDI